MKSLQASPALHQVQHRCLFSLASRSGSNIADGATPCAATVCRLGFRYPVAVRIRCAFLVEREIHNAPIRAPAFCSIHKLATPGLVHLPNSKSCANLARRYPAPDLIPFSDLISKTVFRMQFRRFVDSVTSSDTAALSRIASCSEARARSSYAGARARDPSGGTMQREGCRTLSVRANTYAE